MIKTLAAILAVLTLTVAGGAEARTRLASIQPDQPDFDRHGLGSYTAVPAEQPRQMRQHRGKSKSVHRTSKRAKYAAHGRPSKRGNTSSLKDLTPKLAAKAAELIEACGAKIVSAYRPGARIAGSRHLSLHSRYPAEAVDMTGPTGCIYPKLKKWAGGYSVDYAAVRHVHISLAHDRRERGARFVHYGTRRYARAGH